MKASAPFEPKRASCGSRSLSGADLCERASLRLDARSVSRNERPPRAPIRRAASYRLAQRPTRVGSARLGARSVCELAPLPARPDARWSAPAWLTTPTRASLSRSLCLFGPRDGPSEQTVRRMWPPDAATLCERLRLPGASARARGRVGSRAG